MKEISIRVCREFGVPSLSGKGRKYIEARRLFCYVSSLYGYRICEIARFCGLDHSTVSYHIKVVSDWLDINDKDTAEKISRLTSNSACIYCDSYEDGWCTNFGKEVKAKELCEYFRRTVIGSVCHQCGRTYDIIDSDADEKESFCCKACEYGY